MSTLRVQQTKKKLLELFEAYLDLSDIKADDKEREHKVLTRCVAALAIYMLTGCTQEEAAQSVWDGQDDNGIDAAYYDASDSRVVLVQSKWIASGSGEPAANEVLAFTSGVKDVIEQASSNFAPRLQSKFNDISQAINTPGTKVHIVLISTGKSIVAKHSTTALDRVLTELNGNDPDPLGTKAVLGLSEIYAYLASGSAESKISLDATILDWSYVAAPHKAYFGIMDGTQLKGWWMKHGKRAVSKNIRLALGSTEVNNEIRQTVLNDPDSFWYFNNGITLVADEVDKAPANSASRAAGIFVFKGASVVNGAQTVSTLGRIEHDENLGRVRVPVRVIILGGAPTSFGGDVTRTNNLQNRIEARDFVAQDPQQNRLKQEMSIEGVEYQYLRSDDFIVSPQSCELIEVTTALACASGDAAMATQLKTGIGRFFADLARPPYTAIFNPSVSGAKAFNATTMQRVIDAWIETKKRSIEKHSGFPWGVLIHGNRILSAAVFHKVGVNAITKTIDSFRADLATLNIEDKCERSYALMLTYLENNYPNKFLAVLFKNPSMSREVFDEAKKP